MSYERYDTEEGVDREEAGPWSLEQRVERWIADLFHVPTPEHRAAIQRFLQLARREGAKAMFCEAPLCSSEIPAQWVRTRFPITRTVTEPRVEKDPLPLAAEYRVVGDELQWRSTAANAPSGWRNYGHPTPIAERIRLWASLLDEPTVTRTVEE